MHQKEMFCVWKKQVAWTEVGEIDGDTKTNKWMTINHGPFPVK